MKEITVFKSQEGKRAILDYYKKLSRQLSYEYKEQLVDTSYGKTYIFEAGETENPAILLFHGSCSNSSMWFSDIERLKEKYHVFSVDIIGEAGNSEENRLNVNSDEYANWVNEILDALHLNKVSLMGNSFGGWMSLKFATTFPEKVNRLVLIAASGIVPVRLSFIVQSILAIMRGEKGFKTLNKKIFGMDEVPEEVIYVTQLIMKHFNPMTGALPFSSDESLKKLNMPVLFIAGENDMTMNVYKAAEKLRKTIADCEVQIIKKSPHVIYNLMDRVMPFLQS